MECPNCKENTCRQNEVVYEVAKSKAKTAPTLMVNAYKMFYCSSCGANFYMEGKKIKAKGV